VPPPFYSLPLTALSLVKAQRQSASRVAIKRAAIGHLGSLSYGSLRFTCTNAWRTTQRPVESSQGCHQTQRIKKRRGAAMAARSESSAYLACFIRGQGHPGLTGGSTRTKMLRIFAG
jgi:hypothetical protein